MLWPSMKVSVVWHASNTGRAMRVAGAGASACAGAAGLLWYDCGEVFPATTDPKSRGLTLFKPRFGGTPHRFIKCSRSYKKKADMSIEAEMSAAGENGDAMVCEPAVDHRDIVGRMAALAGRVLARMRS